MSYKNNPVYQANTKNIETIALDVYENGQIGTNSKRIMGEIVEPMITQIYLFQQSAFKNKGQGKRSNKYFFPMRNGWKEQNAKEDYDFLGMQEISDLAELIITDMGMSADLQWDIKNFGKDEAEILAKLKDMIADLIFKEFPNEFETRILNMLQSAFENGVELYGDNGIVSGSKITPTIIELDLNATNTKAELRKIKKMFNKINRLNNPLFLRPRTNEGWTVIASDTMSDWLDEIGAYELSGGDKVLDLLLGNKPVKMFKQTPIIINNEMTERNLLMILPPRSFYVSIPDTYTRSDFVGKSATKQFMKIELDGMGYQPSYWMMKFGNPVLFTDKSIVDWANAFIKSQDYKGGLTATYNITDGSGAGATAYEIVLLDNADKEVNKADASAVGADTNATYSNLPTGTYRVVVRVKATGEILTTSNLYQVSNKTWFIEDQSGAGSISNKEVEVVQEVVEVEEVVETKAETKAKKQEEAEDIKSEAEEIVEEAKEEAKKKAETKAKKK